MAGSIGKVIIPVVSTFDPAGIAQAKAGLKDLAGAQGAGGGGSGSGGADGSAGGISNLAKTAAGKLSSIASAMPGGEGLGSLLSASALGPAAAGVAVFALSQRVASNAAQVRKGALDLNVSVDYYGKLEKSARYAGITIGEVTAGISGAHEKVLSAATGGNMGESVFLESLGLTRSDMQKGIGNAEYLAQRLSGMHLTAGQKAAVFGSVQAADAIMGAGGQSSGLLDQNAGTNLMASRMQTGLYNFSTNMIGAWGGILSGRSRESLEREAADKAQAEQAGKLEKYMQQSGAAALPGLVSPAESARYANESHKGFIYSAKGTEQARYEQLAQVQTRQARFSAEAPLMQAREAYGEESGIISQRARAGGYSNHSQGEMAAIQALEKLNQNLSPTRSNVENLGADLDVSAKRWEQDKKSRYNDKGNWKGEAGGEMVDPEGVSKQQIYIARSTGDRLTDYVQGLTASGPQAGAYGINTVAGASQVMGSEFEMSKSTETISILKAILEQLVASGKMTRQQADTTGSQLGYRYNDPISGFLNMLGNH